MSHVVMQDLLAPDVCCKINTITLPTIYQHYSSLDLLPMLIKVLPEFMRPSLAALTILHLCHNSRSGASTMAPGPRSSWTIKPSHV
jgi:hypothetical protein